MKPSGPEAIAAFVASRTGSSLSRQQTQRLNDAVAARLKGRNEAVYLEHLKSARGAAELAELMSVLSVHKTDLFRDEVQLQGVRQLLPKLLEQRPALQVWSAGCSTGEEVATLLMMLDEAGASADSTVVGTDISNETVEQARKLTFPEDVLRKVPPGTREKHFRAGPRNTWELSPLLRARASFSRHNLMDFPYPLSPRGGAFDLIFCRNVLIYFTPAAFDRVVAGFAERLSPTGVLVLGASEPLLGRRQDLEVLRLDNAFFYARPGFKVPGLSAQPRPPSGALPLPPPSAPPAASSASSPSLAPVPPSKGPSAMVPSPSRPELPKVAELPLDEGVRLFEGMLDAAANGFDDGLEAGLRRALYLTPDLAPARYLLGMLCEQRGSKADAASEYRRALAVLEAGRATPVRFFLNAQRLKAACVHALDRLGYR